MDDNLSFAQACEYLAVSTSDLIALREYGLAICSHQDGKQLYPSSSLAITRHLLNIGRERNWGMDTLAWYADVAFATEVWRVFLLPIQRQGYSEQEHPRSWLDTLYASAALSHFEASSESVLAEMLCAIVAVNVGDERFWKDLTALSTSSLSPIISFMENLGDPILGQESRLARDLSANYGLMLYAFTVVAPPISPELGQIIAATASQFQTITTNVSPPDREIILKERGVAVDRFYVSKATEIHSSPQSWEFAAGILSAEKRSIVVQIKLPLDADKPYIDNIVDMIRPFVGPFGARVVHRLYEIANDPPYFRNPLITVDSNDMLDSLGLKRDSRGIHYSRNRELLRDALNAAHNLEIVGKYTTTENGKPVVKAFYRTVLSLVGATFEPAEQEGIPTAELRSRGLPKSVQLRLNFYDGVRRPDGKLSDQYVLLPRLAVPGKLLRATHTKTADALRSHIMLQYRQKRTKGRTVILTREEALLAANITNKNSRMATTTLRKALERLVEDDTLESFSPVLPSDPQETLEVILSQGSV